MSLLKPLKVNFSVDFWRVVVTLKGVLGYSSLGSLNYSPRKRCETSNARASACSKIAQSMTS